jgi:hypothetical protein
LLDTQFVKAEGRVMRIEARVIPVEGVSKIPGVIEDVSEAEARQQKDELLLLNVATALAVLLVSCAWIAIALD